MMARAAVMARAPPLAVITTVGLLRGRTGAPA
jgi:hypothetical protein